MPTAVEEVRAFHVTRVMQLFRLLSVTGDDLLHVVKLLACERA